MIRILYSRTAHRDGDRSLGLLHAVHRRAHEADDENTGKRTMQDATAVAEVAEVAGGLVHVAQGLRGAAQRHLRERRPESEVEVGGVNPGRGCGGKLQPGCALASG